MGEVVEFKRVVKADHNQMLVDRIQGMPINAGPLSDEEFRLHMSGLKRGTGPGVDWSKIPPGDPNCCA